MAARPETHMSSSSSSSSESYEVFLSFRGEDTRGNFTDHLYHALERAGIRTFRDNEELQKGKEIGQGLMNAIIESKISIPVFSENYASSKWCLKELAQIMKCMDNDGQIVLPVFYKVNPSDIRNQTGSFAEAFLEHEKTQPKGCVDSWRKALKQAGSLKGWHYEKPEHSEANTIDSIVEEVLNELKKTTALHVGDHLIGIDSRVDDVIRLLDLESQDVQYMGICGMGGLGKTTIARAVFNKICRRFRGDSKGLSFLEDVSSTSQQVDGLVKLQNKLVSGILGNNLGLDNVAQGMNIIKERCRNKKVLIILDDVDRDEQLRALAGHPNWFGSGSRIIITTRDEHILQVKQVDETKIYMPEVLNDNQSLQLFCNHAFGKDQPPKKFMLLSRKVIEIVGGLPLAIEVLGSFLYGESCHDVWESMVDSLKKIPHDDIQKILQISYDRLNAFEKDIFLDIACFFIGMDKEIVIHILEDFFPEKNIKVLVRKSLVSIDNNNMLRMHDLLRDMGREIVRQESPKNAGKRTRLWSHDEALDVLKKGKGTSSIEGLSLVFRHDDPVNDANDFANRLDALLNDASDSDALINDASDTASDTASESASDSDDLIDDPINDANDFADDLMDDPINDANDFDDLIDDPINDANDSDDLIDDADIDHCLKIEAFKPLSDLRLLQVDGAYFDGNFDALSTELKWLSWKGIPSECIPSISHLRKLSVLDLSESMITEDWNGWQHIQKVKTLKVLDLGGCRRLTRTPDFSYNTRLQRLILDGCWSLVACDESIGRLKKLVYLTLNKCENIKELPDSICKLSSLTNLILSDCHKLEKLPKALGDMKSLTELIIDKTDIEELPDSIGSLEKLVSLSAKDCCKLARLPRSMGKLRRLQYINLLGSGIIELPKGFGNLWSLKELKMSDPREFRAFFPLCFPTLEGRRDFQSISDLPLIFFQLNAMLCASLESLPNLSNFKSLERLHVYRCEKLTEMEGLNGLSLLQELDLTNCEMLQSLPELPSSLIKLNIRGCDSMVSMPNLSNLKILEEIHLCNCEKLTEIEGLNGLSLLQELDLTNCQMLQSLPELPSSLTILDIGGCKSMESLPNLSNLKKLEVLCANNCEKLINIEGMNGLSLLWRLDLQNCLMLRSLPELSLTLTRQDIKSCKSMESIPNRSNLKKLEELYLVNCEKITKIEGLTSLSLLQQLDLTNCKMLQTLPELPSSLIKLNIGGCNSMVSMPNLSNLNKLEVLWANDCKKLVKIEGMNGSLLQELDLRNCLMLQSLPELPPTLTRLDIEGCKSMESLPNLSNLKILKQLCLNDCGKLAKIEGMGGLSLLKKLNLRNCVMLQSLPELPPSLITMDISYCRSMERLANLSNLKILRRLCLDNCEKLIKIEGMNSLSLPPQLVLQNCIVLQSLPELPSILTKLQLRGCMKLSEIEGIIGLSLLKVLDLYDCRELRSLPDLSHLKKLEELLLERCDNLVEIRGLESLESLKYFRVLRCNTYIKTLQKCVAQGMLVGAFHGRNMKEICRIPDNDENIKGMALLLVYQTPPQLLRKPFHLKVEAVISRNDGERIRCCHDLQIEGMTGTDVDGYYSCYFHGLTWFGLPLRKKYTILVTGLSYLREEPHHAVDEFRINKSVIFQNYGTDTIQQIKIQQIKKLLSKPKRSHQANEVRIKKFIIIPEYETREDSQQLEKRIAHLITCTSVESEGAGRYKKRLEKRIAHPSRS